MKPQNIQGSDFRCWCWQAILIFSGLLLLSRTSPAATTRASYAPGAEFFNEPTLRTFKFEIPPSELLRLSQSPRSYATGQVTEAGNLLTKVAIRLRGHGSFRVLEEKPNFSVKFDEWHSAQSYRGLGKLMFNNASQDSTFFAELVARGLFRDAGVPTARATHAQVILNGRDLGLYVVLEAVNGEFLQQHFKNSKGNLYEANLTDIEVPMEQDTGSRSNQLDRIALASVCMLTNQTERWKALPRMLDVDRFLSFAAMEMLTAHWDGYVLHTNNYRIYHEPKADKFYFIAHGMDWAFLRPTLSIEPPRKSLVTRAVLEIPEGRKLYWDRVGKLFTNFLSFPVLSNRVEQELVKIRGGKLSSNEITKAEQGAVLIRERIQKRISQAAYELAGGKPTPMQFTADNIAHFVSWRADHDGGTGAVDRVTVDGKSALHVGAAGSYCHPSWRSLAYLPRGTYRLEGDVKVAARGPIAAMIRLSGPTDVKVINSATDWQQMRYEFQVSDDGNDVECACDFSGAEGEAWFALDSLRIRRLR
ncbi:MAG TPA: CotH kinase family protein [Candidatus Saccharimonadales bacterium]|nr:CotH kinase family protein [Candidatus Saccharimonadales bacterium]